MKKIKIDCSMITRDPAEASKTSKELEDLGYDGVYTFEGPHEPFLPLAAAALRGVSQPLIKIGLIGWPSPLAAVTIGYITSSLAIGLFAFFRGEKALRLPLSGVAWFTATGLVNGLAVLLLYMALELGSVAVVSPLIACYPLFTLILNRIFFGDSGLSNLSVAGIGLTVFGISLLLSSSMV